MLTNAALKYHYHPEKGWLNDPNGLCYYKGQYHVFYQHTPESETPGLMCWGHAVTRDFITWQELSPAICPSEPYDAKGIWSGTAIEKDGRLYCFYASINEQEGQYISVAYSDDGLNFTKYPGNPIIATHPPEGSNDFRDPAVYYDGKTYYMLIGSGQEDNNTGNLLLYHSDDLLTWDYVGVMYEYQNCLSCECPSFVPAGDGVIVAVSNRPKDGRHYFEVMYGDFDGRKFVPRITSRFQKGPDEYAGQIFHAPDGRNILISWVSGWEYRPKEKCIGCLSLPLEVKVQRDKITAYPVDEVKHLLDSNDTLTDAYVQERFVRGGEEVWIELTEKPE